MNKVLGPFTHSPSHHGSRLLIQNLYSKNSPSLSAKGEYIFDLDNDDMLLVDDLFVKIYKLTS